LRLYQNRPDVAAVAYEHRLLAALARMDLSFAIPAPLRARSGETLVTCAAAGETGERTWAALFPLLPGEHWQRGDPAVARACGAALAELDVALAALPDLGLPARGPTYGEMERIHPLVPEPLALPDALPVAPDETAGLRRVVEHAAAATPGLYARLPRQVIHSDFGTGNVLMVEGQLVAPSGVSDVQGVRSSRERRSGGLGVGAVLDFEFAAPDLRAMDWAVGMLHAAMLELEGAQLWENLEAYGTTYAATRPLRADEVRALPALLRLRWAASAIHRAGRWRQGIASDAEVRENVRDILGVDAWLRAEAARLVDRALAWQEGASPHGVSP
jgi:Ser/Thr protein kinase RdoA (MazF antagonist)